MADIIHVDFKQKLWISSHANTKASSAALHHALNGMSVEMVAVDEANSDPLPIEWFQAAISTHPAITQGQKTKGMEAKIAEPSNVPYDQVHAYVCVTHPRTKLKTTIGEVCTFTNAHCAVIIYKLPRSQGSMFFENDHQAVQYIESLEMRDMLFGHVLGFFPEPQDFSYYDSSEGGPDVA